VIPELQQPKIDNLPLLKSTCIKFIYFFRNQIPDDQIAPLVNMMADYLKSEKTVNQSYAAATIEKMLIRKSLNRGQVTVLNDQNVD
jgi:hypothetical protein